MITGSIDHKLVGCDKESEDYFNIVQKAIEDHGIEASISKIVGSEALAYAVDEGVQILGGNGFIEEYPMACAYRDERINRIFEGTNEINRLIIGGTFLKKAILEEIPIRDSIELRLKNWIPILDISIQNNLEKEVDVIEFCRSFTLFCLNEAINKYGQDLKNEQWVIEPLSNMAISICIMDTCFKRYQQLDDGLHKDETASVLRLSISDQYVKLVEGGFNIVNYLFSDDVLKENIDLVSRWKSKLDYNPNRIEFQKEIVSVLYQYNKYYLD